MGLLLTASGWSRGYESSRQAPSEVSSAIKAGLVRPLTATVSGSAPKGGSVEWRWQTTDKEGIGTVNIEPRRGAQVVMRPRVPNTALVSAALVQDDETISQSVAQVSVPQYFRIRLLPTDETPVGEADFDRDLISLGLRIPAAGQQAALTDDQNRANGIIRTAVYDTMLDTAQALFSGINVVMSDRDVSRIVGIAPGDVANYCDVLVGGLALMSSAPPSSRGKAQIAIGLIGETWHLGRG